jgi:predicted ATPase/class 3 adenylate cyclase
MAPTEIITLLFTDLVRSTELVQWLGDDAADDFRKLHFDLVRSAVREHGGREVKNLGDGFMVVFESAVEGLGAAVAIQRAVDRHNRGGTGPDFQVRVGIHAGETAREEGDYFGTPVILAKRLCDAAAGGQILASEILTGLVGSRGHYAFRSLGPRRLKGLAEAVAVAEVLWDSDGPPEVAPAKWGRVVRPATLTPPPDSFIGRDVELVTLAERLERSRLVTVIGPGGVGKTRLCGHVVDAVAERYPDGVWCCALASVATDEQVPEAVTTALRVERRAGMTAEERLVEFLITKELLLVLDNCEHVIDGAASFASAVLAGTGGVDVLATSREPLGIPGEHRVPLEPLAVPDTGGATDVTPAEALFLERATEANPGLDLDDEGLEVVRALCRRLDGLPLALELAAARVAMQTVHELYADLTDRLGALSVRRGRPERHRSIAAMVEWSYELLDESDRRLFERLAVFAGGWNADAVARVAGDDSDGVLGRLERLVEQSLVSTRSQSHSTRYNLLEPVRAYAEGRLTASGRQDEARDAHAAFFVQLAEEADAGLRTPDEVQWADRIDQEMANLRSAHRWLMQRRNGDGALRLAGALLAYGSGVGVAELHAWAEEAAERFASTGHPALSAAWTTAAWGAWHGGDLVRAEAFVTWSLAAADDGSPGLQMALQMAGVVQLTLGRFDRAAELLHQSVERSRAVEDNLCLVYALGTYGLALAYDGRFEPALHMADAGLEVAAAGGNTTMRAWANYYAGEVRLETHPEEASELFSRSLAEGTSSRLLVGAAGLSAVSLEVRHGDPRAALARFPELIEHWQRSGAWNEMWVTLRILIETLDRLGESERAAVLYGAISGSASAPPIVGQDASRLSVAREHLRARLGPDALRHHEEQGAGLGDNGAVTFALEAIRSILRGNVTPPA